MIRFIYIVNDPYESKYLLLIKKRESTGLKYFSDSKAFIEYSNHMDDIEEYHPNKKRNTLIVFNKVIAEIPSNEKLNPSP